jgi:hypothetical protein
MRVHALRQAAPCTWFVPRPLLAAETWRATQAAEPSEQWMVHRREGICLAVRPRSSQCKASPERQGQNGVRAGARPRHVSEVGPTTETARNCPSSESAPLGQPAREPGTLDNEPTQGRPRRRPRRLGTVVPRGVRRGVPRLARGLSDGARFCRLTSHPLLRHEVSWQRRTRSPGLQAGRPRRYCSCWSELYALVAQRIRASASGAECAGSSPAGGTDQILATPAVRLAAEMPIGVTPYGQQAGGDGLVTYRFQGVAPGVHR